MVVKEMHCLWAAVWYYQALEEREKAPSQHAQVHMAVLLSRAAAYP